MKRFIRILFFCSLVFITFSCKSKEPDVPVLGINLDTNSISMAEGDSATLNATFIPSNAHSDIIWTSSNEKVATVDNGKIKAISRGSATIRAQADSAFASCNITVTRTDLPYQLVWSDEFDSTALDMNKWSYEVGGLGWGNGELQYYTDRPENLRVENGDLVIEARKEAYKTNDYTSARINTKNKFSFTYGKIEARISLPSGNGTWPAFWMMGANISSVRWPTCGEIDIMEHIGSNPTMISNAVHTAANNGAKGNNWYSRSTIANAENNFHVYGIEWEKEYNNGQDCINFYIDGKRTATIWEPLTNSTQLNWPFNKSFFILLNLAVGGTMGGTVDDSIFNNPVLMKIDYIRVYQRK